MLRQEINLYRFFKEPASEKNLLTWTRLWIINLIFLCFFILTYFYAIWKINHLELQKQSMIKKVQQLQKQFYEAKNKFPPFFFAQDVSQSLEKIEQELIMQEKLLNTIISQKPFSKDLLTLSHAIVPHVWLNNIVINQGGEEIVLKGKGLSLQAIQHFLHNLLQEKNFADYILNIKDIQNSAKGETVQNINFEISLQKKTP